MIHGLIFWVTCILTRALWGESQRLPKNNEKLNSRQCVLKVLETDSGKGTAYLGAKVKNLASPVGP